MNRKSDQRKLTCRAAKSDGSPCSVRVREGSDFCFFHNPAKAKELRAAQALAAGAIGRLRCQSMRLNLLPRP